MQLQGGSKSEDCVVNLAAEFPRCCRAFIFLIFLLVLRVLDHGFVIEERDMQS